MDFPGLQFVSAMTPVMADCGMGTKPFWVGPDQRRSQSAGGESVMES